jgi:pimeloyl-ACP methyl ester carboxylesterase
MSETRRQVLFIQGAGEGTYEEWDDKLVESLQRELGDGFEVRYPRMPDEDDPSEASWVPVIREKVSDLGEGAVVVGHSVGGTLLIRALTEHPPSARLAAVVLVATPFVGEDGWPGDGFEFGAGLGNALPPGVPVHVFHGLDDDTAPPSHADLYARAVPQAQVHRLPGRDHQLNDDLGEVAGVILDLPRSPTPRC